MGIKISKNGIIPCSSCGKKKCICDDEIRQAFDRLTKQNEMARKTLGKE